MKNKILIKKKYLIFREDARKLAQRIKKSSSEKISVDFSETIFMSRSFVDELLNQIEKQKKDIKFLSLNPSLARLIPKVKQTKDRIQKILSRS